MKSSVFVLALAVLIANTGLASPGQFPPLRVVGGEAQFRRGQCTTMTEVQVDCLEGMPCFLWWKALKANHRDAVGMSEFGVLPLAELAGLSWALEFHLPRRGSFPEELSIMFEPAPGALDAIFLPPVCGEWSVKAVPTENSCSASGNPLGGLGCRARLFLSPTKFNVECLPVFPSCDPYFFYGAHGNRASYHRHEDCHQIAGESSQRCNATDDVSTLEDGNVLQCFCDASGYAIKTDWLIGWPYEICPKGWFGPYYGPDWGLEGQVCARNKKGLLCEPNFDGTRFP